MASKEEIHQAICEAASCGNEEVLKGLLPQIDRETLNRGSKGQTALGLAAGRGHINVVVELLNFPGIDVNAGNEAPLFGAAVRGHVSIVAMLLYRGANPFVSNAEGISVRQNCKSEVVHEAFELFDKKEYEKCFEKWPILKHLKPELTPSRSSSLTVHPIITKRKSSSPPRLTRSRKISHDKEKRGTNSSSPSHDLSDEGQVPKKRKSEQDTLYVPSRSRRASTTPTPATKIPSMQETTEIHIPSLLQTIFSDEKKYPGLNIEEETTLTYQFKKVPNLYLEQFYPHSHTNWIGTDSQRGTFIISLLSKPEASESTLRFKCLLTTARGNESFLIDIPVIEITKKAHLLVVNTLLTQQSLQGSTILFVPSSHFPNELLKIEQHHPQGRDAMKFGLVYCKKGQVSAPEMFINKESDCSPRFWNFVQTLGKKIDLDGWKKYRGDMRPPGIAWYDLWKDIEIIAHVAPILNAEEKRRLIGNDIPLVFFYDEPFDVPENISSFDASGVDSFGEVPCIFSVIQPNTNGDLFKVGFCSKKNISPHLPFPSRNPLRHNELKDLLFSKIYSGLCTTIFCPPMNRLFMVPRRATINQLAEQWKSQCVDLKSKGSIAGDLMTKKVPTLDNVRKRRKSTGEATAVPQLKEDTKKKDKDKDKEKEKDKLNEFIINSKKRASLANNPNDPIIQNLIAHGLIPKQKQEKHKPERSPPLQNRMVTPPLFADNGKMNLNHMYDAMTFSDPDPFDVYLMKKEMAPQEAGSEKKTLKTPPTTLAPRPMTRPNRAFTSSAGDLFTDTQVIRKKNLFDS